MAQPRFLPELPRLPAPLMAAASAAGAQAQQAYSATLFARRVALARETCPEGHELGKPRLMRLLGEAEVLAEPLRRPRRKLDIAPTANPQVAMILPGFATHPMRMRYLAQALESAGHITKRWGLGRNWGPDPERFDAIDAGWHAYIDKGHGIGLAGGDGLNNSMVPTHINYPALVDTAVEQCRGQVERRVFDP
jgi:hypothetical protein